MRKSLDVLVVFTTILVLVIMSGEALARTMKDYPNSGRCPGSLRYVKDLRNCAEFRSRVSNQQTGALLKTCTEFTFACVRNSDNAQQCDQRGQRCMATGCWHGKLVSRCGLKRE
jgi:hypothetical protein